MDVSIIETAGLGDRSYLISHGDVAVAIDPQRDIDRVLTLADDLKVRITHVAETHLHNDYLTGGLELSRTVGAEYVVPAGDDVNYPRRAVSDGEVIDAGPIRLEAMHTPGHTHHHISYVLRDDTGKVQGVFTGGSMLFGTTGRTDLIGAEDTKELTHAQYHSVRKIADHLPPDTPVYPTHGFGSFCSATPASGDESTVGEQRRSNPALTQDEQSFVDELLAGLSAYPAYYAHMGVINSEGPAPVDLTPPEPIDPDELRRRLEAGEWVVDLRNRRAFAAGHLQGAFGFELSGSFVSYFGWLYEWGAPVTLIGESPDQIADAKRELVRIGVDRLTGAATGDIDDLSDGMPLGSYPVADFAELADQRRADAVAVLDVRQSHEYESEHIPGARNIPLHELPERLGEVPTTTVWVHCASGYRSSIAASILHRAGHAVVLIDDHFDRAKELGLTAADDN
ncbi:MULTISPECIES: MBL fold metallo-hydrolase [unclassified Mycobacterium]|uniref:MBL fold metallo-hydrolase n=1 Tax=unclassified Mycobacterium TaxID=2642494 RepID=UPI0007FD41B9|nr:MULTISPECIES: MBL fold metallo-hydrolase [unclassified Mycobacterium]OBB45275.1 MBL fold metallo-hydrolase [Mycobacterium sp. 852002-51961_SCH5331710]OBG93612.1 MBL fold metallo-hydrolase [Mycobacterium sp. E136]OBK77127.1 MBL fold metallo-hydrolase [Mycobacterium sp. 1164985.4]